MRGVDVKRPEYSDTRADEFLDARPARAGSCRDATKGVDHVYALAADMGGMGFISANHATILHNNALIDIHTLQAAAEEGVQRRCSTPRRRASTRSTCSSAPTSPGSRKRTRYPAAPQDAYGWEKVLGEQLCKYYPTEYDIETRIVRFHNIYGPYGTYDGGREKSPAAMCRKVALAEDGGSIEVWGDGEQTRSFCYIDDCVEGLYRLMHSDFTEPLEPRHRPHGEHQRAGPDRHGHRRQAALDRARRGPGGRPRAATPTTRKLREVLGWEPAIDLEEGLVDTYRWIEKQLDER